MQRLRRLRRHGDERGAVNVVVALLMVPLVGFVALSVDVAAMWADHQQLQSGADAAALAVAQDCARGACGTPNQTATTLAEANRSWGDVTAQVLTPGLGPSTGQVTVGTSTTSKHLFAPVLGIDQSDVAARASVAWGAPSAGTAQLPLTFYTCEWHAQTGGGMPSGTTQRTIYQTKTSATGCPGSSGNVVPGGFGWVESDPGICGVTSAVGQKMASDPGNNVPNGCSGSLVAARGRTVLLPLFDSYGGTGSNAWYRVHGYAAFTLTGYRFSGTSWNPPCTGNQRCLRGYFTRYVSLADDFDHAPGAPDLGASLVYLTR